MAYHSANNALGSIDRSTGTVTTVNLASNQTAPMMRATGEMLNFSYQFTVVTTSSLAGTFIVEVSNDVRCFDPNFVANARFEPVQTVAFVNGLAPNGSSGCAVLVQNGWMFSRCRWVASSGTGTGWCVASGVST